MVIVVRDTTGDCTCTSRAVDTVNLLYTVGTVWYYTYSTVSLIVVNTPVASTTHDDLGRGLERIKKEKRRKSMVLVG